MLGQTMRISRVLGLSSKRTLAQRAMPLAAAAPRPVLRSEAYRMYSGAANKADDAAEAPEAKAADTDAEAANAGGEAEKSEWQVKYEAKDKEAAKLKEAYQRSIADFRNLQKTTEQEVKKSQQFALQKFARDLVESVDNFDLAMAAFPKEKVELAPKDVQEFYNGVHMVQQVLEKTLAKHGIVKVSPLDEKFDPNEHEALFQVPNPDKDAGTIIHVDRTGFKLFDRVLRAPKVGVVAEKDN